MRGGGVTYTLQGMVQGTLSLPLGAFIFCVLWTLFFDFDPKSSTHCEVDEFLPSLSSVIGGSVPQKYVWNICIAIHSAPRFLFAAVYKSLYQERLNIGAWTPILIKFNFVLNVLEIISLVGLSFVSSIEIFIIHKGFFITFLVTYLVSMLLTLYHLLPRCGYQATCIQETYSNQMKYKIFKMTCISLPLAFYFYWRHNEYCEPYVYSLFATFEYAIILGNIYYHGLAYYDFTDMVMHVGPSQLLVR
eukprot:TRINITY_DN9763_c0_g1_i12.p1 TRINITY_DN9763_c0_g1~~TRINITY_DN9763_c0_g1_i12.p1  ORF type:complete len:246 (-),score=15.95 TRINITY_DN9763_c0_g1_i12:326-1063(-)